MDYVDTVPEPVEGPLVFSMANAPTGQNRTQMVQ